MPNWVFTEVKTDPETILDIKRRFTNEKGEFSFQLVHPMPEELDVESSSIGEQGLLELYRMSNDEKERLAIMATYLDRNMFHSEITFKAAVDKKLPESMKTEHLKEYEKMMDIGRIYLENYKKYGSSDWYGWRNKHWGTKWDACDPVYHEDMITFTTAWSFAEEAILALSQQCPAAKFHCRFADEAMDDNSGIVRIQNGKILSEKYGLCKRTRYDIWGY